MRGFKQLVKNFLLFSMLLSFLLSTSGFVVTRHICTHHSTEILIGDMSPDGCCEMEKTEANK